ncbi:MAG: Lin0512 family protein [Pseudomonadota bacterium]
MALKRVVLEMGMGTDIRGDDPTKAAVRALRDALWHNSLGVAEAVGLDSDQMQVEVTIGVPDGDRVDRQAVLDVLPHGTGTVNVVPGGLKIPNPSTGDVTLLAHAAAVVRLDIPEDV